MTKTMCSVPGCNQPRKVSRSGKLLTRCELHEREFWRNYKAGRQPEQPEEGKRRKRKQPAHPESPAAAAIPVEPSTTLWNGLRILALRCDVCGEKKPYTAEHYNIAAGSTTCRECGSGQAVTVVDPLTNTARRGHIVFDDESIPCGEGAEAYAAFARQEHSAGVRVLVQW